MHTRPIELARFEARVCSTEMLGHGVRNIVLSPSFSPTLAAPGCHIDVYLEPAITRQYSLWSWDHDAGTISIAVKREQKGHGGSEIMHSRVNSGDILSVSAPRMSFPIRECEGLSLLIAAGIGATAILPMAEDLINRRKPVLIYYLARLRDDAPFADHFRRLCQNDQLRIHYSNEAGRLNFVDIATELRPHDRLYVCGPEKLTQDIKDAVRQHAPFCEVHSESFSPQPINAPNSKPFEVFLARSQKSLLIPEQTSILDVLNENGINVPRGCCNGLCGSCLTRVISGDVIHRDAVLSADEQRSMMCLCVSRAASDRIVLDL